VKEITIMILVNIAVDSLLFKLVWNKK